MRQVPEYITIEKTELAERLQGFIVRRPKNGVELFDLCGLDLAPHQDLLSRTQYELSRARFDASDLRGLKLRGRDLTYASFKETNLAGADLSNADLTEAKFDRTVFSEPVVLKTETQGLLPKVLGWMRSCQPEMTYAVLAEASLQGQRLRGADLSYVKFDRCKLNNADLADCNLTGATFFDADLRGADLTGAKGLDLGALGGANLASAKLPVGYDNTIRLKNVEEISKNAGKQIIALMSLCAYSLLTLSGLTTPDKLAGNGMVQLPLLNISIPVYVFFLCAPVLIAVLYIYFHFYCQYLWREIADLPSIMQDGDEFFRKTYPWMPSDIPRLHFPWTKKRAPLLAYFQYVLSVCLGWLLAPLIIVYFWASEIGYVSHSIQFVLAVTCVVTALFGLLLATRTFSVLSHRMPPPSGIHLVFWKAVAAQSAVCSIALWAMNAFGVNMAGRPQSLAGQFLSKPGNQYNSVLDPSKVIGFNVYNKSLVGAHMDDCFVANADLRKTQLVRANLSNADLRDSDLRSSNLTNATAIHTDFRNCDLQEANLTAIVAENSRLDSCDLSSATLNGADLKGANLTGATLTGSAWISLNLDSANVSGLDFSNLMRTRGVTNLRTFRGCPALSMVSAHCENARFDNFEFYGVNANGAYFSNASFKGAEVRGNFVTAKLCGAVFDNAILEFNHSKDDDTRDDPNADLHIDAADVNGAHFEYANAEYKDNFELANNWILAYYDSATSYFLFHTTAHNSQIMSKDLSNNQLPDDATIQSAPLIGYLFLNTQMKGVSFTCDTRSSKFDGAVMPGCQFSGTLWHFADDNLTSFRGALLEPFNDNGSAFTYCRLGSADFSGSNLRWTTFDHCDLSGANFTHADLTDVTFKYCYLSHARFIGSTITNNTIAYFKTKAEDDLADKRIPRKYDHKQQ